MHNLDFSRDTLFWGFIAAGLLTLLSGAACYLHVFLKLKKNEHTLFKQTGRSFTLLLSLIFSFVAGYSAVLASIAFHHQIDFNFLFGPMLFLGSIFVLGTAYFTMTMFTKLLRSREILKKQAQYDFLTKLPNRRLLVKKITQSLKRKRENKNYEFNVVFIDILNFKRVNDSFGHYTGDKILIQISNRLLETVETSDTVGRLGGDDFIILFENSTPVMGVKKLKKIRKVLQQPYKIDGIKFKLGISYGMCSANNENINPEELINRANIAMRRSKQRGKNRFSIYVESMSSNAYNLLQFENDFRRGLRKEEFVLVFQPQYRITTEISLAGFEALVRWKHPERGWITPGEFIPMAEETGLIVELDRYVLDKSCRTWSKFLSESQQCSGLHISVNLSAMHVAESTLVKYISSTIKRHELPADTLILELTESAFILNPDVAATKLNALQSLGVRTAIDDFGTGYSSLAYLKNFPAQCLKIDKSFIDGIESDTRSKKIVHSIINLAHSMGMDTVAEGVENKLQLQILKELDCDMVQGFYLAKPISRDKARQLIDSQAGINPEIQH